VVASIILAVCLITFFCGTGVVAFKIKGRDIAAVRTHHSTMRPYRAINPEINLGPRVDMLPSRAVTLPR
jgi:hypothetical protein